MPFTKKLEEKNRLSWEDLYIQIASLVSLRSKDPRTKVGAVLVKDNHILGIGYNGEPRNFKYSFNWNTEEKYDYVIHAEMNAIANATSIGANVVGADIYLTMSPCKECIKLLIQHQIKNVYYLKKYRDFELVNKIAKHSQLKLIRYSIVK